MASKVSVESRRLGRRGHLRRAHGEANWVRCSTAQNSRGWRMQGHTAAGALSGVLWQLNQP
jgi:hypothetical protein